MRGRPKKVAAKDAQTRRETLGAKDAQNGAEEVVAHQGPETAAEAQPGQDAAQDTANVVETAQPEAETAEDVPRAEVEAGAEGAEAAAMVPEAGEAGAAAEPGPAQTAQPGGETTTAQDALASAASMDTDTALALKRWREHPTCCCGCGKALQNSAKCFLIGHDGKLKSLLRRVLRNEVPLESVPSEAVLRHREIRFIMTGPEYRRLVEAWQKAK